MSVSSFVVLRGAALKSNARYDAQLTRNREAEANLQTSSHIARYYASHCSQLTIRPRGVVLYPTGGAFGSRGPVGVRAISYKAKTRDPMENLPINKFTDAKDQRNADKARSQGHVVIKSEGKLGRNARPYLQFGPFFLRENCQCSTCVHPDTKQRIVDTFKIPPNVKVQEAEANEKDIIIKWSDNHESTYSWDWLVAHQQNTHPPWKIPEFEGLPNVRYHSLFSLGENKENKGYPEVNYEDVMSNDASVLEWLENIWKWGFCFVKGVPVDPESTKTLIERIAFIRHTHYGGFWDFTADLTFKDTAYTNEFLGAHTDNTYFTDPARLQLFHLLSHTDGDGGASLLVDGYAAAQELCEKDPRSYQVLIRYRHPWHASGNEDVCIQPSSRAPVLSVHPDMDTVYQIRWNNYDRAPKGDWNINQQKAWYKAAARYNKILHEKNRQIWRQLEPGTALIFDNWRMLHGRSEFTGKRRMCGGYVNNDDFVSRFRLLKYGREKVLNNLGNTWASRTKDNPYSIY
ncbi:Trimethyllysine dioxygenase [Penicillium sp. IBT 18751x]|nr:Trimethyllysine dioxygenase [Penicillium sp. IBT 18751x]